MPVGSPSPLVRGAGWLEERKWVNAKTVSDALDGLERQVALAPLEAADVGAVKADELGKRFLTQAPGRAEGAQVLAYGPL